LESWPLLVPGIPPRSRISPFGFGITLVSAASPTCQRDARISACSSSIRYLPGPVESFPTLSKAQGCLAGPPAPHAPRRFRSAAPESPRVLGCLDGSRNRCAFCEEVLRQQSQQVTAAGRRLALQASSPRASGSLPSAAHRTGSARSSPAAVDRCGPVPKPASSGSGSTASTVALAATVRVPCWTWTRKRAVARGECRFRRHRRRALLRARRTCAFPGQR